MDVVRVKTRFRSLERAGLVLLAGFLWSIAIAGVDVADRHVPPVTLTTLRLGVASAAFAAFLVLNPPSHRLRLRGIVDMTVLGLLNIALPFLMLPFALRYISGSLAAVLFNVSPPLTLLLAHLFLHDEKLNWNKLAGTAVAVAGAVILMGSNASGLPGGEQQGWIGQLLILVSTLFGAFGVIYMRLRARTGNLTMLAAGQVFASLLLLIPAALLAEGIPPLASYPLEAWLGVLAGGLASPVLGYALVLHMAHRYSASLAGFSSIATPLFSVGIGVLFLGDVITWPIVLGGVLVLAGILWLNTL